MKTEMVREYAVNHSESLNSIALNLSQKYRMKVSASTIRKYAKKELGNVYRKDGSALKSYQKRQQMTVLRAAS